VSADPASASVRAILLDIEGTTTPIAFVDDVLFPYARRQLRAFLARQGREGEANAFQSQMDRDSKSTALKALQGQIWEDGYRSGELVGQVFDDVPTAFERWHSAGLEVGIFSSGSVLAQQLLFRQSSYGDLTPFLRWYFDTTTGAKTEPDSYRRIAAAMKLPTNTILFVSDVTRELDAAREAGMQTRLALRPGNAPQPGGHGHQPIGDFNELFVDPRS
jgi:enolase-phosphatase E1